MRRIKIGDRLVGEGEKTFIIAEIGSNFDGSLEQAKKMVDLTVQVGADAVKFQSFLPDKIIAKKGFLERTSFQAKWDKPVYEVYKEVMFPRKWHKIIADYSAQKGIIFLSTPYDREAVDLLEEIDVPAYKIGSGDITFLSFIQYIAKKNKPIILSTGASCLGQIEEAVNVIRSIGNNEIILLQCITNYPTPIEQANVKAMRTLKNVFRVPVGYSDHTVGRIVPLGAVGLGACIIEKHFTFDKTRPGPDHPFAMDVKEFSVMVKDIRLLEKALGSYVKEIYSAERETVILQRRSLYASKDISEGEVITEEMTEALRPAKGLLPKEISKIVGRKARRTIKRGEMIKWEMI